MDISVQRLVTQLRDAESGNTRENWQLPEYVFSHIFWPLLNDETVRFSELDFSRFDYDDLDILAERLSDNWLSVNALRQIADIFLTARPVSVVSRAFC